MQDSGTGTETGTGSDTVRPFLEEIEEDSEHSININPAPAPGPAKTRKKGCKWLYVTHDEANVDELLQAWDKVENLTNVTFKIEPSIFHIQCRSLSVAKKLVSKTAAENRTKDMCIMKYEFVLLLAYTN